MKFDSLTVFNILAIARSVSADINPIDIKGRQFIDSVTNEPFLIRGVDYQPGGSSGYFGRTDPLSDIDACTRDVYMFQKLGLNAIRVYTVNPDLDHDQCMSLLASVGIYLILDVNSPRIGESLNRYEPWTTYTKEYFDHIFKVIHQFAGYNNTLGFFSGNEIINDEKSAGASPNYIRAVIRDMKMYLKSNGLRAVPIGYSAADDLRFRIPLAEYLECGDAASAADFYGVNSYQWCGHQTFATSGYDALVTDYAKYSLPLFLSEYGCNAITPRTFQEVEALYSPSMTSVFSGGLVYEYSQGSNNYGLVEIGQKGEVFTLPDYENLREQMSKLGTVVPATPMEVVRPQECLEQYDNLFTKMAPPDPIAQDLILNGSPNATFGRFTNINSWETTFRIFDHLGNEIVEKTVKLPEGGSAVRAAEPGIAPAQQAQPATTMTRSVPAARMVQRVGERKAVKTTSGTLLSLATSNRESSSFWWIGLAVGLHVVVLAGGLWIVA